MNTAFTRLRPGRGSSRSHVSTPRPTVACPTRVGVLAAVSVVLLGVSWSHAQCVPGWTTGFELTGKGANGPVHAMLVWDDGSGAALYAGGEFTQAGGVVVNGVAKWDGSNWTPLGGGVGGASPVVTALAVYDADGPGPNPPALIAAGFFSTAGGVAANNIAQWNGTAWFALGSGTAGNTGVNCLAVFGGHLYAGGSFTSAGGIAANFISRWDGTSWGWPGGASNGTSGGVYAMAVFQGSLHVAGAFPTAGLNPSASWIARWTGAGWADLAGGLNSTVHALTVYDNGSGPALYVGGNFTSASGGIAVSRVAKWDGLAWSALGAGVSARVRALIPFNDGNGTALYAAGEFLTAGGISAPGIAKWNGTTWSALGSGLVGTGRTLAVFDDDGAGTLPARLFVGGNISHAGGVLSSNVARWGCGHCYADCNKDGVLNLADFGCYQTKYALNDAYADCNGDGAINLADFGCFQAKYAIGCP
jgi:hypothetical protein